MAHLKRYSIPAFWPVEKKRNVFIVRPAAGAHPLDFSMPLQVVLRDVLHLVQDKAEASKVIKSGEILVDKKARKDLKYPVGFMDVLEIPKMKKVFRVEIDAKGLMIREVEMGEAHSKTCKIKGKSTFKKGRTQINLHDGRNILVDKDSYRVGDSLVIELPGQKILGHVKFATGANAIVTSGKNMGMKGTVKEIKTRKTMTERSTVILQAEGKEMEVPKDYVMVIG